MLITEIVERLRDDRLLSREQQSELFQGLVPLCSDWNIISRELVHRRWLTPYQTAQLSAGRGDELVIGSYVIESPLGEGSTGRLYRVRHTKLGSRAAIKVIRRDRIRDPRVEQRFRREIRAISSIRHPHVVHAFDAGVDGERLYYVMELVDGVDLEGLIRRDGPLTTQTACRYAIQMADALDHISTKGFVHRDVKPGNILITADGGTAKLADLGLTRLTDPDSAEEDAGLTHVGIMIGTPDYVAPEQIRSSRGADIRSDLYSLGCTLYCMLTGRAPFADRDVVGKLNGHLEAQIPDLAIIRPDIPAELVAVVRKLTARRARDRYQLPREVTSILRRFVDPSHDTVVDAVADTLPGVPGIHPDVSLPNTAEIPVDKLQIVQDDLSADLEGKRTRMSRLRWIVAGVAAGLVAGMVISQI